MPVPPFTEIVETLPETVPFVGPEAIERQTGVKTLARIGANESGFGPSPKVVAALAEAAPHFWKYPDPENFELRHALAQRLGVAADEIVIGEGIDGLMGLLVRLFIAPGNVVATSLGGYPTFNYHVTGFGGVLATTPYKNDHEDPEGLAELARSSGAKMVYLANPDNPMGTWWPAETIEAFIKAVPEDCLIVLDEAYGETAPAGTLPKFDNSQPNLIRLRTFSKAYGMAGIRVGYAIGNKRLIGAFNRIRNHFGVSHPAQVAAMAALADEDHLNWAISAIHRSNARIAEIAAASGLSSLPTATNFVAVDCGRDGAYARRVLEELGKRGIFIRKPAAPILDRCIRISAGPDEAMDLLAEHLPASLRAAYEG